MQFGNSSLRNEIDLRLNKDDLCLFEKSADKLTKNMNIFRRQLSEAQKML